MAEPVKIRILDHDYLIQSEEEEGQVYLVAEYLNRKFQEVKDNTEGVSDKRVASLAALNIASDYFQLQKERYDLMSNLIQRTESVILYI